MKKPVVLLIVLGVLVGFAAFYSGRVDKSLNSAKLIGVANRDVLFPELPVKEIREVVIREGKNTVTLAVVGDKWVVKERDGYAAAYDKISRAVAFIADMKLLSKRDVGKSVLGEVNLIAPGDGAPETTGLQVELKNEKGEVIESFIAGKTVESTGGASSGNFMGGGAQQRWVRSPKDKDTSWLTGESFFDLQADPKEWLDKSFIDVQEIKSVEITHPNAADSWAAARKDLQNPFMLQAAKEGEELDTAKADGLNRALSGVVFNDVLTKEQSTADFLKGATKVKVQTFKGFTYEATLLEKKEGDADAKYYVSVKVSGDFPKDRQPAADEKPEDKKKLDDEFAAARKASEEKLAREKTYEGKIYEVSSYGVSDLLKKRSEVLREKAAEPASGAASVPGTPPPLLTPPAKPTAAPAKPEAAPAKPEAAPAKPAEAAPPGDAPKAP